jgi:hypothetical protein
MKILTNLQLMVSDIEKDLGLSDLSEIERKVLISISDIFDQLGKVPTSEILSHPMLRKFSRPALFRALKILEAAGNITKETDKRGYYALAT